MSFLTYCPECKKNVSAALTTGSSENLKKDEGEVILGHPTDDPRVGDHTWIVNDPKTKANLKAYLLQKS